MNPARSTVDGNEEIAPCRLVGHLRQVPDVDIAQARLVVLEGLFSWRAPVPSCSTRLRRSETPWRRRQRPRPARETAGLMNSRVTASRSSVGSSNVLHQLHPMSSPVLRRERRVHLVRRMRKLVFRRLAVLPCPLSDGLAGDVVHRPVRPAGSVEFLISSQIRWVVQTGCAVPGSSSCQ